MAFVVTQGELAAITREDRSWMPSRSVTLAEGRSATYAQIWRTQPNVRTVVSFLARNIAQLRLHVFRRVSDIERVRLTDHPLTALLSKPSPKTTAYRLIDTLVSDLALYDNAFWLKMKTGDGVNALIRWHPGTVSIKESSALGPETYRLQGKYGYRDVPANDLVHFHGYNPDSTSWGSSPIEALRSILAEEYHAGEYRRQLWRNGARLSGYLRRPLDAPEWSQKAKESFRKDWQSQYSGDGPQSGGTPILEDGMEFTQASFSPEQAQYLEARKLTREEVAAAYHIPLPMVGILDHATFSNITEQHKQLYQDTLGPWLTQIQQEIELQLLPDLDASQGIYVEFNMAEKLKGSFEEQAQSLQTAVGAPWMTRGEARARMNLPPIDGADQLVTPLNVLLGGQASPRDSAPKHRFSLHTKAIETDNHVGQFERMLSGFFSRQASVVLSRAGRKAWKVRQPIFDRDRWNDELAEDMLRLGLATSTAAAVALLRKLGLDPDIYDEARTVEWMRAHASGVADGVNGTTEAQLTAALASDDQESAIRQLFDVAVSSRAAQIARTEVTALSGFGATESMRQQSIPAMKTWLVTSSNPRPSHAAMNGETVALDDLFSNGARWPADSTLDDDERAGCTCDVEITFG